MLRSRSLVAPIEALAFRYGKMAFLSGPRQSGKTTLAKTLLSKRSAGAYFNWDDVTFRRLWAKDPRAIVPPKRRKRPLVVLDEVHKARGWKRSLKGVYDTIDSGTLDVLVTGSARLNVYAKGGDSLLGRYLHFRLHPFSLRELESRVPMRPDDLEPALRSGALRPARGARTTFESLQAYGAFPEPFLRQDASYCRLWRRGRVEKVVREDLRDLSRIPELSRIEMLAALLPERVASGLSVASLRDDLEVSHDTVTRWLGCLKELYYLFELKPYQRRIRRSIRKQGKGYLWDHSEVPKPAARFENLIASHLLKACHFWTDTGEGNFELFYLRDKEEREIDFLISREGKPWLAVEAKLGETEPAPAWRTFLPALGYPLAVQVVERPGHWRWLGGEEPELLVASADRFLAYLV